MTATLLILLPFLLLISLVVIARQPLWRAAAMSYGVALLLWSVFLQLAPSQFWFPMARALQVSLEIALILFGAIFFLECLKRAGRSEEIKNALVALATSDNRVHALLLSWLFCAFLEGAAGFGTPAAIVAPLLMSLGFTPIGAATLPLVGDSVPVAFGAVGTPVRIGFEGLDIADAVVTAAGLNLALSLIAPLAILVLVVLYEKPPSTGGASLRQRIFEALPLAFWAGLCFSLPAYAASYLGPEFPSLLGSLVGMAFFLTSVHFRFLLPRSIVAPSVRPGFAAVRRFITAFSPYLLLCLLLLVGKLVFGELRFLVSIAQGPLAISVFQPGLIFVATMAYLAVFTKGFRGVNLLDASRLTFSKLPPVWLAILCMAGLAQTLVVLIRSQGIGFALQGEVSTGLAALLVFATPFIGAFGSFVTGSATVSNLLCAPLVYQAAAAMDVDTGLILALQLIGAASGNMIAFQNLAAVQVTVGLINQERALLKRLWLPCLILVFSAALLGLALFYAR